MTDGNVARLDDELMPSMCIARDQTFRKLISRSALHALASITGVTKEKRQAAQHMPQTSTGFKRDFKLLY